MPASVASRPTRAERGANRKLAPAAHAARLAEQFDRRITRAGARRRTGRHCTRVALIRMIVNFGPATIPGVREAALDLRALAFAGAVTVVAAVLAGLVPARRVMGARVKEWLTERGAGPGSGSVRLQQSLVVGQISDLGAGEQQDEANGGRQQAH